MFTISSGQRKKNSLGEYIWVCCLGSLQITSSAQISIEGFYSVMSPYSAVDSLPTPTQLGITITVLLKFLWACFLSMLVKKHLVPQCIIFLYLCFSVIIDTPSTMERSSTRSRLPTNYYNIAGQVIEASGLRGELGTTWLFNFVL